jgi:V/A-type H+-transporting ATPase subunit C
MRSRLLDAGRMEELLSAPTLDAFIQALNATPYGHEVQEALSRYPALQAVDAALARNLYRTTTKIHLANLRVILRGKHAGSRAEDIAANLIAAGSLHDAALRALAEQPDVPAVVGALSGLNHPFVTPLQEGMAEYLESKDLFALELRVERFYALYGLRMVKGSGHSEQAVRALLQAELDATNVKTAVKLQSAALSREGKARFFIPGGRVVSEDIFLLLTDRETLEQGVKSLRILGFPLKTVDEDLTAFERALDLATIKAQTDLYLGDPLSIDIVVAYLALKSNEVKNLRLIARSKQLGIPRDRVRKEMVGV